MSPALKLVIYCCVAVTIAMLMGETLKWFFGRHRPMLLTQGLYGFSFLADESSKHSFPSGHTFRIFSAVTALSLVRPRARIWLFALACAVGISRVLVHRHYPSDIVAGAFVGIFCSLWVWRLMQGNAGAATLHR
jgi:membrane-associated phospholipid phosphatase